MFFRSFSCVVMSLSVESFVVFRQMARTTATVGSRRWRAAHEDFVGTPARGRRPARDRGFARGAAPARDYERGVSPEPSVGLRRDRVPSEIRVAPLLQETLLRVLGLFEGITSDSSTVETSSGFRARVGGHAPIIRESLVHDQVGQPPLSSTPTQTTSDSAPAVYYQLSYELFHRMEPPQFRGGSDDDAYEF